MGLSKKAYAFYRERTLLVISILFLIGGLLIWLSWGLKSDDGKAIVLSFGVGAISLGAYTATSEYFLKVALTDDLLEKIDVKAQLLRTGFYDARPEREFAWKELLAESPNVDLIVARPNRFREIAWPHLIAAAKSRAVRIQVFLPLPERIEVDQVDGRPESTDGGVFLTSDPSYQCAKYLEQAWEDARSANLLTEKAAIRIAYLSQPVTISVARTESQSILLLESSQVDPGNGLALSFQGHASGSSVADWVGEFVESQTATAEDSWSDLRKKGPL